MTGLSPILSLLGEFLRQQRHRIARVRARCVDPTAPAHLVLPRALAIANTRSRA